MSLYLLASEISKAFDYIENNLTNKIVLEDIAAACGLSKYHLHRILSAIANRPLMEYVRARKLSESLGILADRKTRIIDVALEYSFDYEQSYIRAFRKEFGVSPGAFRRQSVSVKATEKICPLYYTSVSEGLLIQPTMVFKSQFCVAGRKFYIEHERNRWDSPGESIGNAFLTIPEHSTRYAPKIDVYIGLTRKARHNAESACYLLSREVPSQEDIPQGLSAEVVPSSRYAVFKYIGLFSIKLLTQSHFEELWEYIDHVWLLRSTFKPAGAYHFECINTQWMQEDYCEIDLYMPISE